MDGFKTTGNNSISGSMKHSSLINLSCFNVTDDEEALSDPGVVVLHFHGRKRSCEDRRGSRQQAVQRLHSRGKPLLFYAFF